MQKILGLVLSCGLMAIGCSGPGAAGAGASQDNHEVSVAKSPADACFHLQELAAKSDPWAKSDSGQCRIDLKHEFSLWEPRVGEGVIQCILEAAVPETVRETCSSSAIAASLGLGLKESELSITDACLSLRSPRSRIETSFDGPACESNLAKRTKGWQPSVVQAVLQCIVSRPADDCHTSSVAKELGLAHPAKSKANEAYATLSRLQDQSVAHYAATSRLPLATASTPFKDCCSQGGMCQPNVSDWSLPGWKELSFKIEKPHYYSYSIETESAADGKEGSFTIVAVGDLDCDGTTSRFTMYGEVRGGKMNTATDIISQERYE